MTKETYYLHDRKWAEIVRGIPQKPCMAKLDTVAVEGKIRTDDLMRFIIIDEVVNIAPQNYKKH